jgi:hypothetical protein
MRGKAKANNGNRLNFDTRIQTHAMQKRNAPYDMKQKL